MNERPALEAMIFDTDGVVTRTTAAHFAAWKRLFDDYLRARDGDAFDPFTDEDYRRDVDGKPRYDGVAGFLSSRDIALPWGDPTDPPGAKTICALGNQKDEYFLAHIREHGVAPFATTIRFVTALRDAGLAIAVISASRNCQEVLNAAGVADLFDVRVDGLDAARIGFAGKPDPAIFLEAAERLGVAPDHAGVVEDATAGVEAARRGRFASVIGLDRTAHPAGLSAFADLVVPDLGDVELTKAGHIARRERPAVRVDDLTSALEDGDVARRLEDRTPAVFLDYDGTLTPIVGSPELAKISTDMLAVLTTLAVRGPVAIVSGRDLDDVRAIVRSEKLWFAGSHGLDLLSPEGARSDVAEARSLLPQLDAAEAELGRRVASVPEAWVERKRFAIAVHFRQTPEQYEGQLAEIVASIAADHEGLRTSGGKKIIELRPDIAWDKGRAVRWILEQEGLDRQDVLPVYIGDDVTDEDAFLAVRDRGLGIVVGAGERETAAHNYLSDVDEVRRFLAALATR